GDEQVDFSYSNSRKTVEMWRAFEGVIPNLERRYKETESPRAREMIAEYMASRPCPDCNGARLRPESLAVTVSDRTILDVTSMSIGDALGYFNGMALNKTDKLIAERILKEIRERLGFLHNVGLDYLTLDRNA